LSWLFQDEGGAGGGQISVITPRATWSVLGYHNHHHLTVSATLTLARYLVDEGFPALAPRIIFCWTLTGQPIFFLKAQYS
jgi:hypothetical protein